ncbi:1-(5-phosphoribosyl)-5-[(5-phosphoribosylamino)methylideneamino]imidazole-4-carboxamide isomerase [Hymenobacter sp. HMF4947]|uniref:1-(5-phosphoribosyl)-5-[(5-phosphoribosylamino)methylideneamino] imidazole-4-carboxamide isomerase n=1 Tax=Hymenobacter ginkgonis TaxID=2682976 RepID=A0A7K1TBC6_9BACT|nr:1-(5-phosphoribosyl)-5-[(5-phosphoribosylamino)methylideneamino] imidazole-4-carboxamide isomerase [Hymenobacter ginkgonis]MVN75704.1 1-(5-phosphoribosyl)-5-[(5-phosphoribosylamino)methylideneamino]imidazole-4-carboxamide isomerase [Hymenobacter ginkgonis]
MDIIPAIDLIAGSCVRLTGGDFARQTTYAADPLAQAQYFEQLGAKRLHLVDLDGARAREPRQLSVLERIARHTGLHIDFGGGIQTTGAAEQAFAAGAAQLTAGSIAAREPALVGEWLARFGAERIIIGADFKGDYIAVSAWTEQSSQRLPEFIAAYLAAGATTFICTDVSRDGQLQGPATDTYTALRRQFPAAQFVASGGVTTVADVAEMREVGMAGAIIGKAIYEGTLTEADLRSEWQR